MKEGRKLENMALMANGVHVFSNENIILHSYSIILEKHA